MSGTHRMIVGASGSPGSLRALRYARYLARCLGGIPLVAVTAWVPPGGDLAERRYPCPPLRRVWEDAAAGRLRQAIDAAWGGLPPDQELKLVIIRGEAGPALVQMAESADDLLIVGAGRGNGLARLWRGRVSRYCATHAQCPVIAVPPGASAQQLGLGHGGWTLRHRELTLDRALRDWNAAA